MNIDAGMALKLEPGAIYALEHDQILSDKQISALQGQFTQICESMNVRFVVLPAGMRIARQGENSQIVTV